MNADLGKVVDLLQCNICYNPLTTAMMLSQCSHNYCSLCIRKWLGNKPHCPTCRKPAEPSQLVNNRVLDEIILALNRKSEDGTESSGEDCAIRSTVENISNSSSAAQCPVCLGSIGEAFLNSHLDLCLKKSQSSNNVSDRPKPLPKLAYNLLSDKQLKKILADQKISTKGKRNDLIWRHKEVVTRYNANLDSLNPLSLQNIIREVEKIERMRDLETKRSTSSQQMTLPCMQSNLVNNASLNLNRNIRENSTKKHSLVTNKRKRDGKIFQNLIRMHTLKFPRLNKNRSELREKIRKLKESLKVELQEDSTLEISKAENDSAPIELAKEDSSCSLGVSDYRPEVHSRGFVSLDSYRCGIHCYWRILWSEKVSRPFFFNSRTKIGQFNEPSHQNCPS